MPSFLVSFPSKNEADIRAVHKILFGKLANESQPPVVGTTRYISHQFSSFEKAPLEELAAKLKSLELEGFRIEGIQIPDTIGIVHNAFVLFAEDRVSIQLETMTARVLELEKVTLGYDGIEYDGWIVSYETLGERG